MKLSLKKRFALGAAAVATVGAVATLAAGVTFGLFSATTQGQTNSFTAGTVTLAQSATTTCSVGPMSPGDGTLAGYNNEGTDTACSFTVTYGGNVPAWLGLDVSIASTHAGSDPNGVLTGAAGLYDSTANGLQFTITDSQGAPVTYMTGTTLGGTKTSGASATADDLLVNTSSFSAGQSVTFTVNYGLPITASNAYQGAASSITLLAHAAQANNNALPGTCASGQACAPTNGWS